MTVHFNSLDKVEGKSLPTPAEANRDTPGLYRNFFKRVFDILIVLASSIVVLPILTVMAAVVLASGQMPFYKQKRVGKSGRIFTMWKLQTMVSDADKRLEEYLRGNPEASDEWSRTQKLKDDPRITPYGRFLRKTSMDELPQLWNVLLGDMSLVGPRPMMPEQMELYPGKAYYALRPGVTGYWQVSDRNEAEFSSRAKFDTQYNAELSLVCDARVLAKTIGVVLRGTGY